MSLRSVSSFLAPLAVSSLVACSLFVSAPAAHAQDQEGHGRGSVHVPDTSVEGPEDRGQRAHTNHRILISPDGGLGPSGGMTPAQMHAFYNVPSGGSGTIAVVLAYHYPTAVNDFNVFSKQFGLPQETGTGAVFQVAYATNKQPRTNGGWAQEAALDIEWSHAMAPNAKIILVEAASSSLTDLFAGVEKAKSLGASQISMSWGGSEFSGETSYDSHFTQNASGITFFTSSGDTGGTMEYPAASPYVVAVGGTSVTTDSAGNYVKESGWSGSGGGVSVYEPKPSYQSAISVSKRGVPDISANADPNTGVCVYDSTAYQGYSGWMVFGGTSVSSPCMAGMVNSAGHNGRSTASTLSLIYQNLGSANYRDITTGTAGSFSCSAGWDLVTGVGSPLGTGGL